MSNAKIQEAEAEIKRAEKYLKTSMFKWNPDYDSAGDCYSKAATAYKLGGNKKMAVETFDKACEMYKQMRTLFQAARMLEQAVLLSRDLDDMDGVVKYAERGALLYRQDGSNESAAQLLEKACKIVESNNPEQAIGLYMKAAETVGVEDRPREASEYMARAARLQVRCKLYDDSIGTLCKAINVMMTLDGSNAAAGRSAAGLVLVYLMKEDHIAATKAYDAYGAYCDGETSPALRRLLAAFDEEDHEAAKEAINSKAIKNLDIDFARLARLIPLPDSEGLANAAAKLGAERAAVAEQEKAAEAAARPPTPPPVVEEQKALEEDKGQNEDQSDDEDDLC